MCESADADQILEDKHTHKRYDTDFSVFFLRERQYLIQKRSHPVTLLCQQILFS